MRRGGVNGGTDAASTLDTINAAATAIASADNRLPHVSSQKRRWGSCWSFYWCFGSQKNKRIGHAVLVPETTATSADPPTAEHPPRQPPSIVLPFIAPPSSPASFLPSEPPSATQSPTGLLSHSSVSANMYSPGGPASIFTIGPYAHETQLVSPPVFSTFTTEPSTAPYTPPPESLHLTTPSSPEVPFAHLLEPYIHNGQKYPPSQYEFLSYQLQPGSPVSHLISPCSGFSGSGTSSPFLDREFAARHPFFLEFQNGNPPKLLDLDKIVGSERGSCQGSGVVTPDTMGPGSLLNRQISDVAPLPDMGNRSRNNEAVVDHRVSFEITAEEIVRCVEKKTLGLTKSVPPELVEKNAMEMASGNQNDTSEKALADGDNEQRHQKNRTITLGSAKEFNFSNIKVINSDEPSIMGSSDWWVNEKVVGEDDGPSDWSFFPMMQTGVS